jgi:hypothetical protein
VKATADYDPPTERRVVSAMLGGQTAYQQMRTASDAIDAYRTNIPANLQPFYTDMFVVPSRSTPTRLRRTAT